MNGLWVAGVGEIENSLFSGDLTCHPTKVRHDCGGAGRRWCGSDEICVTSNATRYNNQFGVYYTAVYGYTIGVVNLPITNVSDMM